MIKAVFFDIDDTLFHFSSLSSKAMRDVSQYLWGQFGITPLQCYEAIEQAQKEIAERIGANQAASHNRQIRFQNALALLGKPIYPHANEMYRIYWNRVIKDAEPEEGIAELLEVLQRRKIYLGIGSDMTSYIQNKKLEKLKLAKYFNCVVTSEEAGQDKPAPQIFELCIQKAGVKPEECLFIGDHLTKDIQGAKNAGMQAACYNRYSGVSKEETNHIIESYQDCIRKNEIVIGDLMI